MNILKQFVKSLYSPRDIAAFRFQGIGKTILYVFLLTLLSVLPSSFYFALTLQDAVTSSRAVIESELPEFSIHEGQLRSAAREPISIKNGSFTMVFDSTGAVDIEDFAETNSTFGLLKDHAVLNAGGQSNTIPYTLLDNESLSKKDMLSLIDRAGAFLPIFTGLFFVAIYILSSGMKFIEITLLAFCGLLLKHLAGKNLEYRHLWRMAGYSVTLPTLFFAVMALLKTDVPNGFLINWFVSSMILLLAIKEIPSQKNDLD